MKKIADFIVEKRIYILITLLVIAGFCATLIPKVEVNTDLTKYLPDDSSMKIGMDIMEEEFPPAPADYTIRVMFKDLTDEEIVSMKEKLSEIKNVNSVDYKEDDKDYNRDGYTKFVLHTVYEYESPEESEIEDTLEKDFNHDGMEYKNDNVDTPNFPVWVGISAVVLLTIILIIMCESWVEPFLFLFTIGIAVVINLGTNIIQGSISENTFSIAAILQLVLSIDYSIILTNRYRQEMPKYSDKRSAMKAAIVSAFSSISSSSLTTVVGLLALIFMSFKIGLDMGFVMAKGVFLSVVCVFLILPGLVIMCTKWIDKTAKKPLHVPTGGIARFCNRFRIPLTVGFIALFVAAYLIQRHTVIAYSISSFDPVAQVFPKNGTIVLLYENKDDEYVTAFADELKEMDCVLSAANYSNTLGKQYNVSEMTAAIKELSEGMGGGDSSGFELNESMISLLFIKKFGLGKADSTMSIEELFNYVNDEVINDPTLRPMIGDEMAEEVKNYAKDLNDGIKQLKGDRFSRLILTVTLPEEGDETTAFYEMIYDRCDKLKGEYHLIGSTAMNYEMSLSFAGELLFITLLTAISIYLVVLITFRSFIVPVILVLLVQCGVFITVSIIGFQGYSMYFIALLVVQCILMGSMIDYGILFSNYYREFRKTLVRGEALKKAYECSIHTILTSGMLIVTATAILSKCYGDPTVEQMCKTISIGAACAICLILFVLPGILACLDRFTGGKNRVKA